MIFSSKMNKSFKTHLYSSFADERCKIVNCETVYKYFFLSIVFNAIHAKIIRLKNIRLYSEALLFYN